MIEESTTEIVKYKLFPDELAKISAEMARKTPSCLNAPRVRPATAASAA